MKYAFFPGCNAPAIRPDVEQAIRLSLPRLGIELVDMEGYVCCPAFGTFPSADESAYLAVNAWNLSIGEEKGCDLVAQCGSCYSSIKLGRRLMEDDTKLAQVNEILHAAKRTYKATNNIRHITDVLFYDVGVEKIKASIIRNLAGMHCVVQYPCHTLYPSEIVGFEPSDNQPPRILRNLVEALGAAVDSYSLEYSCCGGSGGLHTSDLKAAHRLYKNKLDAIKEETEADFIVCSCITCLIWMDSQQKLIGGEYSIPVFDYNQLLALCLGFEPKRVAAIANIPRHAVIEKIRNQQERK